MTYKFHTDAGHGWLQVKRQELVNLGIVDKITPYSHQYLDSVYLEEDLDAGTFIEALQEHPEIVEVNDGDYSTIRDFDHYRVD